MMDNENILIDIYFQNKKLESGRNKLFIESIIRCMPDRSQLAADTFNKFELYKQLSVDLKSVKDIKINNKDADNLYVKIKPN